MALSFGHTIEFVWTTCINYAFGNQVCLRKIWKPLITSFNVTLSISLMERKAHNIFICYNRIVLFSIKKMLLILVLQLWNQSFFYTVDFFGCNKLWTFFTCIIWSKKMLKNIVTRMAKSSELLFEILIRLNLIKRLIVW
jgi:hypothetical protein